MKKFKISLLASSVLVAQALPVFANDGVVDAETLVGKFYGGIHAAYLNADNDRLQNANDFNKGLGLGLEGGYRLAAPLEFRLSYTRFKSETDGPDSINKTSLDALYFPTEKSIYLLGGISGLDFDSSLDAGINAGLGYRYYFTSNLAAYAEGKVNYEFEDSYTDAIGQLGFIYYFGVDKKSSPVKPAEVAPAKAIPSQEVVVEEVPVEVAAVVAPVFIDTDNDGIEDSADKCLSTPVSDKVDAMGCTIFSEEKLSHRLSVNFDSGQSVIKEEYYAEIENTANFLTQYPYIEVTVDGYSSVDGNDDYNKALSQKRADAVVAMLVADYGIDASRLTAIGHGETNLIDTANTAEAHKKNRRIEINVLDTQKKAVAR